MSPHPVSLVLLAAVTVGAHPQTASTHRPVRHTPVSGAHTSMASAAASPADNPPNIPHIAGTPKPLYALRYVDTTLGTGPIAEQRMYFTVRYTGWLTSGTKFDSSDDHPGKEPITFPYGARRVIPGWDTGFENMHVGGKRRLYIPYQLAYGLDGRPPVIPAKSDLIFDIELVSQSANAPAPPPSAAPTEPAQAPGAAPSSTPPPAAAAPAPSSSAPAGTPPPPAGTPPPPTKPETAPQQP